MKYNKIHRCRLCYSNKLKPLIDFGSICLSSAFPYKNLKYNSGSPVINDIKRISKPGRRFYASAGSIPKIQNGLGIAIVSTSKGVMTDADARKANVGGEIICKVF